MVSKEQKPFIHWQLQGKKGGNLAFGGDICHHLLLQQGPVSCGQRIESSLPLIPGPPFSDSLGLATSAMGLCHMGQVPWAGHPWHTPCPMEAKALTWRTTPNATSLLNHCKNLGQAVLQAERRLRAALSSYPSAFIYTLIFNGLSICYSSLPRTISKIDTSPSSLASSVHDPRQTLCNMPSSIEHLISE